MTKSWKKAKNGRISKSHSAELKPLMGLNSGGVKQIQTFEGVIFAILETDSNFWGGDFAILETGIKHLSG